MQTQRSFFDNLKHQYRNGGMFMRLIFINVVIFLLIQFAMVIGRLSLGEGIGDVAALYWAGEIFTLKTIPSEFITHPWGLFTSMFAHFTIGHLFWNMLFLFFVGRIFEQYFDQKRMIYTYVLAGVAGGLLEFIAHLVFPGLPPQYGGVVGASGSVMGIFFAVVMYNPRLKINLIIVQLPILLIAALYLLGDILRLGLDDQTAHFAHIGGAIIGMISVRNIHSSTNFINVIQQFGDSVIRLFSGRPKKKLKVKQGKNVRTMTDEEYNANAKSRQEETDRILDKISKSGYESLTKKEKDFLFNQSRK